MILGLGLGVFGVTKLDNSEAGISIGGLEISAENESAKNQAYIWLGLGALALVAGVFQMRK